MQRQLPSHIRPKAWTYRSDFAPNRKARNEQADVQLPERHPHGGDDRVRWMKSTTAEWPTQTRRRKSQAAKAEAGAPKSAPARATWRRRTEAARPIANAHQQCWPR